ncbi:Jerky protein homolog-like [Frankliniella fusca]|uniref:Jerky protein homolog-like n=1 Tax=Frankliniella fusca TaxID=407009 RepID=A0AAE1HGI4_9NEOP|nr:Jerky protein homolog-like [Frankliniella fusca]
MWRACPAVVREPLRRSPRKRNSGNYQPNTPSRPKRLQDACRAVAGGMPLRAASYAYNFNKKHDKRKGRPTALSATEELALVDHLLTQADWGFPLSRADICSLVKAYLDRSQKTVKLFNDNLPGIKWARMFLERHPRLNFRVPTLIKTSRSKVDPATVTKYFENLEQSVNEVPPENIVNYDETGVADTPAQKKLIVRRGEKYPVKCLTSSKSQVSVMFAGTTAGHLFPPYVVYKSKKYMSENWVTGGPPGARYIRTLSGWFNHLTFEDWFLSLIVPWASGIDGPKVIIGDNVSSHFSSKVIKTCAEYNIRFVCLPPNSTHLLQPLDVAFSGPLKNAWKRILLEWKDQDSNRNLCLPKPHFPALLKKLVDAITERKVENLRSGFRATGIFPFDKNQALKRMPGGVVSPEREETYRRVSETFIENLQEKRHGQPARRGGKRLRVSPGKSWAPEDLSASFDEENQDDTDDHGDAVDATGGAQDHLEERRRTASPDANGIPGNFEAKPGDWVLVKFAGKRKVHFSVGFVNHIDNNKELACKFLCPGDKAGHFAWPNKPVIKSVDYSDVELVLSPPKKLKKKGLPYRFAESFDNFLIE